MKSPFLVAAQMKTSNSMLEQVVDSSSSAMMDDGSNSSASSSSLSSSTSSSNGYSSSTATPSKRSSKKKQQQKEQQRKKHGNGDITHHLLHASMPDLDALPGSLQVDDSEAISTNGIDAGPTASKDRHLRRSSQAGVNASNITKTRSRAQTRALREAERHREAKRWSTTILVTSALPIAAVVVYDLLYPAHVRLSTEHTRQASWHLSTIASKCLHLSYQIPSSSSSALANLFHLTNPHDLQSPSKASSTSHILANALSTAPASEQFLKGVDDVYIVLLWIAIWTFFREFVIRFIGGPIGRYGGIKKSGALLRFGEQGYDVISHVLALTFGFYIMQNQDSGYKNMNLEGLWKGYPHYKLNASIKLYYLCQMGFWLQQVLTLHLEKRRKDYTQMFIHHILTVSLLYLSYLYNFTRIGNVILVLMDVSDIILGTAKMLKYLKFHENICNFAFGLFMLSWIITRHILYPRVLYSVIYDADKYIKRDWNPNLEWYWTRTSKNAFVLLLSAIQLLVILWFFMIVKVAVGVLRGKPAEDTRSDDEDESEDVGTDIRSSTSISPSPSPSSSSIKPKSIEKANGVAGKGLNGSSSFKSMSNGHINEAKSAVRNRK